MPICVLWSLVHRIPHSPPLRARYQNSLHVTILLLDCWTPFLPASSKPYLPPWSSNCICDSFKVSWRGHTSRSHHLSTWGTPRLSDWAPSLCNIHHLLVSDYSLAWPLVSLLNRRYPTIPVICVFNQPRQPRHSAVLLKFKSQMLV